MESRAMQSLLDLRVVREDTSRHQVIQQALQLLQEGLAVGCSSDTQRHKKRPNKDSGKGDKKGGRGGWSLYWTYHIIIIIWISFFIWS